MKRLAAAGVIAAILTLFTPSPANADEGCVITVAGIKVCGELLNQPLPELVEVTVTVRPDPIRIPVPGPTETRTITVRPDPVTIPGGTRTVTEPSEPRTVTETVTTRPNTVEPSELPSESPDATETATGQDDTSSGTVGPSPEPEVVTETETRTKTETIVRYVALGTLVSLALALLGTLAMFIGYGLGQRDAQRNEDAFLNSLLDSVRVRKRP